MDARSISALCAVAVATMMLGTACGAAEAPVDPPPSTMSVVEPPSALPAAATAGDRIWQPAIDYDTDGCYSAPAIGPDGVAATGLLVGGEPDEGCRDAGDLDDSNTYVRTVCRGGWCARKYALYFEKDQDNPPLGGDPSGHRHDIEHIVVWVHRGKAKFVAVSQHGDYEIKPADEVLWEGSHPKVAYHRDDLATHAFRFAEPDDEPPENDEGTWQYPALVSWGMFPPGVRAALVRHNFGGATLELKDTNYSADLALATPDEVPPNLFLRLGRPARTSEGNRVEAGR